MEELWSGNETASTSGTNITLTKKWTDYDAISFEITNTSPYYSYPMILTKDIEVNQRTIQIGYNSFAAVITFLTDTTAKIEAATSDRNTIYKKIYGIKFGGGGGSSEVNYSTAEQVVGTWIDGKPIYQRTLQVDQSIHTYTGGWSEKDLGIVASDYDINMIIKCFLWCVDNTNASTKGCVQPEWTRILNGTIRVSMPQGWNANAKSITLQYTKTTD
jgi:hypothetical protein